MRKFWIGVYVGASAVFMIGLFTELDRMANIINEYRSYKKEN